MKKIPQISAIFIALAFMYSAPLSLCFAEETYVIAPVSETALERFDNDNWFTLAHPRIASFSMFDDGSMHGSTVTGVEFAQFNVVNDLGIRVQRFEMEDHYHFIIEGEVAYTFEDFSAKLAQAYAQKVGV